MKFPIILFLPIPVLLLLVVGCSTEVIDAPPIDAPIITINETPDNMTIINETPDNMTIINASEVMINVTNTSAQNTTA